MKNICSFCIWGFYLRLMPVLQTENIFKMKLLFLDILLVFIVTSCGQIKNCKLSREYIPVETDISLIDDTSAFHKQYRTLSGKKQSKLKQNEIEELFLENYILASQSPDGSDFNLIRSMQGIEQELINKRLLIKNNKQSYLELFELLKNDSIKQSYIHLFAKYDTYQDLQYPTVRSSFIFSTKYYDNVMKQYRDLKALERLMRNLEFKRNTYADYSEYLKNVTDIAFNNKCLYRYVLLLEYYYNSINWGY